jgi:hypothetical protein
MKHNTMIIGCWIENSLEGFAIYSSGEKGEQLWKMKKNKISRIIEDDNEVENIKKTQEYKKLENFYNMMTSENPNLQFSLLEDS